ncbi:MAG: hypothetical protein M1393_00330 [Candidatus Thermoplasmatota archaeon]|nr:hypothetical protein [Candidatus Thermoplasmatota archaeon]MCL6089473.1 hypothetical protein [Candidatus Thermoplasmatota archaeon]MDA8143649.1 hypothetical protein [Thermoplasmatales archaeon]
MNSNKGGITFAAIVIVVIALSFSYILTTPVTTGVAPTDFSHTSVQYVDLGANAAGWKNLNNFENASAVNPTLSFALNTLVYFNVTEEDGAPHNLYISYDGAYSSSLFSKINSSITSNPAKWEGTTNYGILSTSQITQTIGHVAQGKYPFHTAGIYTYWCTIHFEAMYGIIVVSTNSTPIQLAIHSPVANGGSDNGMTAQMQGSNSENVDLYPNSNDPVE